MAVKIKGRGDRIKIGVEQRDAAIKAGAEGATTIVVRNGAMMIPPDYNVDHNMPDFANELRGIFELRENDVIIIGTGLEYHQAEDGALAAAFELL